MNEVGIVTFHRAHNYGAVLQAFALEKAIEKMGYTAGFVDLQSELIGDVYRLYPKFALSNIREYARQWAHLLLDYKRKSNRYNAFENFIDEKLNTVSMDESCIKFKSIVLGSDQIWNYSYMNGFDSLYFGVSDKFTAEKTISYAASMGKSDLTDSLALEFKSLLENLDVVGVREEALQELISSKLDMVSEVNLDPTLLLDKDDWVEICASKTQSEPYLLVYEVQSNPMTNEVVNYISSQTGLKVVVLSARTDFRIPTEHITDASPQEFIRLFRDASYVVTTSFHGTVFSIINNVPFTTVAFNNDIDIRSSSLLKKVGLDSRMLRDTKSMQEITLDQNFTHVNDRLSTLRQHSLEFISHAIK